MCYVRITEYVPGTDKIDIDIQTVKNSTPNAIIEGQLKMRSREVQATVDEGFFDCIVNDRTHFEIFEDEALTRKVVDLDLRDVEFGDYLNKIYTEAAEKRETMRARRLYTKEELAAPMARSAELDGKVLAFVRECETFGGDERG